ncbi:hypothetical protein C8Q80DRAFT_1120402 [Daedaleopsis nitida]|nr:hypothetical protein C8Q80DRAFT_1120402 [Daedaleopsis nitida]
MAAPIHTPIQVNLQQPLSPGSLSQQPAPADSDFPMFTSDHLASPQAMPPSTSTSNTSSRSPSPMAEDDPTVVITDDHAELSSMWESTINCIIDLDAASSNDHKDLGPALFDAFMAEADNSDHEPFDSETGPSELLFKKGNGIKELPEDFATENEGEEVEQLDPDEQAAPTAPQENARVQLPHAVWSTLAQSRTVPTTSSSAYISPDCPTYPWPDMSYSLKKIADRIRDLVGDPTRKVVSLSGNVFYINDVSSAIGKDYSNPITRPTMLDYPVYSPEGHMLQVHHGDKLLNDLLGDIVAPAVIVNNKVFFVYELLRRTDHSYFIPE